MSENDADGGLSEDRVIERRANELKRLHSFRPEVAETVATIEAGYSHSGAAARLGVSETAITSRVEHVEDLFGYGAVMVRDGHGAMSGPLEGVADLRECPKPDCRMRSVVSLRECEVTYPNPGSELKRALAGARSTGSTHVCVVCGAALTFESDESDESASASAEPVPDVLGRLREMDAWIARSVDTKMPVAPWVSGEMVPVDGQNRWAHTSFRTAWEWYEKLRGTDDEIGLGFVPREDDDVVILDLDDCRDPESGEITPEAREVIDRMDSYAEVSPSGRGVHVVALADVQADVQRAGFEMYRAGQYCTVTFDHIDGTPTEPQYRGEEIESLFLEHGGEVPSPPRVDASFDDEDAPESGLYRSSVAAVFDVPAGENTVHPVHGSTTGSNFKADAEAPSRWRCWRCSVTANVCVLFAMLYLVDTGVPADSINCERVARRWKRDDHLVSNTWAWAVAEDLIDPAPVPSRVDPGLIADD